MTLLPCDFSAQAFLMVALFEHPLKISAETTNIISLNMGKFHYVHKSVEEEYMIAIRCYSHRIETSSLKNHRGERQRWLDYPRPM
ncbi:hypothetical protein AQZ50_08040 [Novosphingobium sp. Fuku2-ISO-50]|nr:hypothetical protein AQZ50_08040 [Novosphingobium sp. Fuku2-ISO-50]